MSAILEVDPQLMIELLRLPPDTRILDADVVYTGNQATIRFIVDHPHIPSNAIHVFPHFSIEHTPNFAGNVTFEGWGGR